MRARGKNKREKEIRGRRRTKGFFWGTPKVLSARPPRAQSMAYSKRLLSLSVPHASHDALFPIGLKEEELQHLEGRTEQGKGDAGTDKSGLKFTIHFSFL